MKRLLDGSLPPRAEALLRSATSDVPPRTAAEKARLVSVVAAGNSRRSFASGKWLGLLSIVVATAGIVGIAHRSSTPSVLEASEPKNEPKSQTNAEPASTTPIAIATTTPAEKTGAPRAESVDVTELPTVAPVVRSAPAKSAAVPHVAASPATAEEPRLEDELAAIDQARAAFVEHQPALALERVTSYRRRFPSGHFMAEAEALEIQALVVLERREEASTKAARFLAAHPDSPYAQRVRSAVGQKP